MGRIMLTSQGFFFKEGAMKKSTNFSAEKGRRLKIFATIFAAIFALIALATGLALKNYGGGEN